MLEEQKLIAEENGIDDISDAFGKTLLLRAIWESMSEYEANLFVKDTLMMLQNEIEAYELQESQDIEFGGAN